MGVKWLAIKKLDHNLAAVNLRKIKKKDQTSVSRSFGAPNASEIIRTACK